MLILEEYKPNQFGILLKFKGGDEKIVPWHSILTISKPKEDVIMSIGLVSLSTINFRVDNKSIMDELFDKITGLTEVAV